MYEVIESKNKSKARIYNSITPKNKQQFDKIELNKNEKNIEDYYNDITGYCSKYKFDIIYGEQSNDFIKMYSDKMIIGLGTPNVIETSITLHHIYGIPYIPGQSIKGAVRNYFLENYYDSEEQDFFNDFEVKGYSFRTLYNFIFGDDIGGDNSRKGGILFFDAFPCMDKGSLIESDVMTPHYSKYYSSPEKYNPSDDNEPTPIPFYVLKNSSFKFPIAINKKLYNEYKKVDNKFAEYNKLKKFVYNLFIRTIEENGLGAKTSIGYGHFYDNQQEEATMDELKKLQEKSNK